MKKVAALIIAGSMAFTLAACGDSSSSGEEEQKNLMLPFRGSENQRVILMDETLKSGEIVLSPLMDKID